LVDEVKRIGLRLGFLVDEVKRRAMAIEMTAAARGGRVSYGSGVGEGSSSSHGGGNAMQAWWEGIARARAAIDSLDSIVGPLQSAESLKESDRPARGLLDSQEVAQAVSAAFQSASSGSASDRLCHWLYDTFLSSDPDLQLVVLRYVPILAGIYLSRLVSDTHSLREPLAGFEAVLLALYSGEVKARGGRPLLLHIPDLAQPSLYHAPRNPLPHDLSPNPFVGQLSAPLEPQAAVKSTKRASIVGVALDLFYRKVAVMPAGPKIDMCHFVQGWAGQNCSCARRFDDQIHEGPQADLSVSNCQEGEEIAENTSPVDRALIDGITKFSIHDDIASANGSPARYHHQDSFSSSDGPMDDCSIKGARIPLPWELLQPILRILGHCLLAPLNPQEVKDAASSAARVLFARVSHDLVPEAILATRSLIRLDISTRANAMAAAAANAASNTNTPTKHKKPEVFLASR
jgi:hypothetical protein